jgi:hypothetical protein
MPAKPYGNSGDQVGSEAKSGVAMARRFRPVTSTV